MAKYKNIDLHDFMYVTKALADENRVRMVMVLRKGELCICQLVELFGLAPSTVSKHMSILRQARLVRGRKSGRWTYYRLAGDEAPDAVHKVIGWLDEFLAGEQRIAEDMARLEEILKTDPEILCSRKKTKLKVLFLCTGNSCRSQMAEGWARCLKRSLLEAHSAGIEPRGLDPRAAKVMAEAGVDISGQRSKHVDEVKHVEFDYVITVCDRANESCPLFPGRTKVVHVGFDDPPALAVKAGSEEEALSHYRRVRDEIKAFVETLPEILYKSGAST